MSWVVSIFFLIATFVGSLLMYNTETLSVANAQGEMAAISGNMAVYHGYVVTYAQANVGVTGAVSDAALGLPSWFNKTSGVANYVTGGKGYVYYTNAPGELAYQLLKDTNNSIYVGIKQSGYVTSPLSGTSSIAVPAAIPDGVVVYAN